MTTKTKPQPGETWTPRNKRAAELGGGYCRHIEIERVSTRGVEFVTRPGCYAYTRTTAYVVANFVRQEAP